MRKIAFVLLMAIALAGGAVSFMTAPSHAQVYNYPPPPPNPYDSPWVGPDTPWVYYNGDWFLNGILYYFFGPVYGWCPYYAYPYSYVVRPGTWYAPRWTMWYRGHRTYWDNFHREYPYWNSHRQGHRYDRRFFEQHHGSGGAEWHKGVQGRPAPPVRVEGRKSGPAHATPYQKQQPGVQHTPQPGHQQQMQRQQHQPQQQHPGGQHTPQVQ